MKQKLIFYFISVTEGIKPFTFAPRFEGAVLAIVDRRSLRDLRENRRMELVLKKAKFIFVVLKIELPLSNFPQKNLG